METRHPAGGLFDSEFPVICNHCVDMVTWSHKTWKFCEQFFHFFGKSDSLQYNFQNSVWKVYMATPIVVVFRCRKICLTGNGWNCALFTGKIIFGCLSNCLYCTDRAQNLPGPAPNSVLTVQQISSKSVQFRQSNSQIRRHHSFAP